MDFEELPGGLSVRNPVRMRKSLRIVKFSHLPEC
jgi:hypothetical protein